MTKRAISQSGALKSHSGRRVCGGCGIGSHSIIEGGVLIGTLFLDLETNSRLCRNAIY
jgi:hypothetical protein